MRYLKMLYFGATAVTLTTFAFLYLLILKSFCFINRNYDMSKRAHKVAQFWGQSMFHMMPGWSIEVFGKENLPEENEPVVYVANHQSNADIWAVYFLGVRFSWLSKAEVFKIPMVGGSMRMAGYISIQRGQKASHKRAMEQSLAHLKNGVSMFFFPEGTRSKDKKIKAFKAGAFHLAEEAGVSIQPLVLFGTGDLLEKGSSVPSSSAQVELHILPRVDRKEDEDLESYMNRVRETIVKKYESLHTDPVPNSTQVSYSS